MPRALLKRENGDAFFLDAEPMPDGSHIEGGEKLGPDDVVDGIRVRDWKPGVYTVTTVEIDGQLIKPLSEIEP